MAQDPAGRVACETVTTTGMVMVMVHALFSADPIIRPGEGIVNREVGKKGQMGQPGRRAAQRME